MRCSFKGGNYKRRHEVFLRRRKVHKNKNTILIRRIGLGANQKFLATFQARARGFMSI